MAVPARRHERRHAWDPVHPDCPCFGDQPLIGADRYGFYVTTNEYDLEPFGGSFNGAQIYAFDKAGLANGGGNVVLFEGGTARFVGLTGRAYRTRFSPRPRRQAVGSRRVTARSTLSATRILGKSAGQPGSALGPHEHESLASVTPSVQVDDAIVTSQTYGFPPDSAQMDGPSPRRRSSRCGGGEAGFGANEYENLIDGNDDRMLDGSW